MITIHSEKFYGRERWRQSQGNCMTAPKISQWWCCCFTEKGIKLQFNWIMRNTRLYNYKKTTTTSYDDQGLSSFKVMNSFPSSNRETDRGGNVMVFLLKFIRDVALFCIKWTILQLFEFLVFLLLIHFNSYWSTTLLLCLKTLTKKIYQFPDKRMFIFINSQKRVKKIDLIIAFFFFFELQVLLHNSTIFQSSCSIKQQKMKN